ncbi:MAG: winged helix-turn-helix domain-containing protein [Burkholderiaceae bacterium]
MKAQTQHSKNQQQRFATRKWELRAAERILLVDGKPSSIGSRAFELLDALVSRRGRVVSKSELIDAAWPGRIVEENNLTVQIAALRKVIGADAIRTVPGIGYSLSAASNLDIDPAADNQLSSPEFLGRESDINALHERLRLAPLVTIVGTGGVGKTSLAREVLARHEPWSADRKFWIDLAPVRDTSQFVSSVAKGVGIELGGFSDPSEELLCGLEQVKGIVALDNCEHLLECTTVLIRKALGRAPGVRWLATSQEPLRVVAEEVYRLGPLEVPGSDVSLAQAMEFSAIALLCNRAAAADRHFVLDEASLPMAIELCRQLDGLPLAIEMAAKRVASLGLETVFTNLDKRLQLLVGPNGVPARHHSLQSTLDWSHDLLSDLEKRVFRNLEPFLDGFSIQVAIVALQDEHVETQAADAISEWRVLDALDSLANKSLIHRSAHRGNRLFLFESARDYARHRLEDAGEIDVARRRHCQAVAQWFDDAQTDADRMNDALWIDRYATERHNVRAALTWACIAREPDTVARLTTALASIDSFTHSQAEVLDCNVPLDVLAQAQVPLRARAHLELSWSHYTDGNREVGTDLAKKALEDFSNLGDDNGVYRALAILMRLYESRPGLGVVAQQTLTEFRSVDDRHLPLRSRLFCAIIAGLQYGASRSIESLRELERIATGAGFNALGGVCRAHITDELLIRRDFKGVAEAAQQYLASDLPQRAKTAILNNLTLALIRLGQVAQAYEPARSSLRISPKGAHVVIDAFALAAAMHGDHADAAILFGHGARVRQDRDNLPDPAEAAAISDTLSLLRTAMNEDRLGELVKMGAAMSSTEAIAIALPPT